MTIVRQFALASLWLAGASWAQAQNIIYQHDFDGSASTPLHGLSPDVDNSGLGSAWVTRTDTGLPAGTGVKWFDDGSIDVSLAGSGAASLAFTPGGGNVYTLTASFNAIGEGATDHWVAMGFSAGQATGPGAGAEFFGNGFPDQITGQPWMLYRNVNSGASDQTFLGPGTAGGASWSAPVVPSRGAPVDLRIVLDTTAPAWTAQWFAKNPADPAYTEIRSTTTYAINPTILAVAFTAQGTVGGSIDSFTLSVVPEPSGLLLGAMGLALMVPIAVWRRKR